jgi:hypothetical protein
MYRSGLVDTLVTHANTNGVWPNSLVRRPPWLHASSVKNKQNKNFETYFALFIFLDSHTERVMLEVRTQHNKDMLVEKHRRSGCANYLA